MSRCLHITVKGRVQGVYFRVFTQKQAAKLNIKGHVRNHPEGYVEIVASGEEEALQQFLTWCHKGPVLAKVKEVIAIDHAVAEIFEDFQIR